MVTGKLTKCTFLSNEIKYKSKVKNVWLLHECDCVWEQKWILKTHGQHVSISYLKLTKCTLRPWVMGVKEPRWV